MKPFKALSLLILAIAFTGCHKDYSDYRMDNQTFVNRVSMQQHYILTLNQLLPDIFASELANQITRRRQLRLSSYFSELNVMVSSNLNTELDEMQLQNIDALSNLSRSEKKVNLRKLLIEADQDLLAMHIKATGYNGLRNENLRNWAAKEITALQENLQDAQILTAP